MPNPESALNEEAGKLLLENYEEYFSRARLYTEVHARQPASLKSQYHLTSTDHNLAQTSSSAASNPLDANKTIQSSSSNSSDEPASVKMSKLQATSLQAAAAAKKTTDKKKALKRL